MADRKKVMKGLQCLSSPYAQDMNGRDCENCQYDNASCFLDITADALALLKEQPEIVRCSECIRRASYDCPVYDGGDGMHDEPDDWFCGDGERRV